MAEPRGCNRCGGYHLLQVTQHDCDGETIAVRLCLWCRRKGVEETLAAQERMSGKDA